MTTHPTGALALRMAYPLHRLLPLTLVVGAALALSACSSAVQGPRAWIEGEWRLDLAPLVQEVERSVAASRGNGAEAPGSQAPGSEAPGGEAQGAEGEGGAAGEGTQAAAEGDGAAEARPAQRGRRGSSARPFSVEEQDLARGLQQHFSVTMRFAEEGALVLESRFQRERTREEGTWEVVEASENGLMLKVTLNGEESVFPVLFRDPRVLILEEEGRIMTFRKVGGDES